MKLKDVTGDKVADLLRTQLCILDESSLDRFVIFSDIPKTITDEQFNSLIQRSFSRDDVNLLFSLHQDEVITLFPPKRVQGMSRLSSPDNNVEDWKTWVVGVREWLRHINGDDNDFEDDT